MKDLTYKGKKITDTFQYQIFHDRGSAMQFCLNEMEWNEDKILDRTEIVSFKIETGEIINAELSCLVVDTGSEDYIYYL